MPFKEQAMLYHEQGWNVLPIWPPGVNNSNGKDKPCFPWAVWTEKKQTKPLIQKWVEDYGECNIAIITGDINNLLVVDFDDEEAAADFQLDNDLPKPWTVKTSKGYHFYFKHAKNGVSSYVGIRNRVDIRCNGGYVVAPDSKHLSGFSYRWEARSNIMVDTPECVYAMIKERKKTVAAGKDGWVEKLLSGVKEGERNAACARLAGHYAQRGLSEAETVSLLAGWDKANIPPMGETDVRAVTHSIFGKDSAAEEERLKNIDPIPIDECKRIISKWIYYKDDNIIDLALAVAISTFTDQDPCWIILVGAASTGKTELLRAFDNYPGAYFMDKMTTASFATGFKQSKGLLERVNNKHILLVIQDLSTIFSKPQYEGAEILDALRQIYNGKYHNEWGNGKKVIWQGKFNLLSASTPEIESRNIGELGERFLYYRIVSNDEETRGRMKEKAKGAFGKEGIVREEIRRAIYGVLKMARDRDVKAVEVGSDLRGSMESLVDIMTALRSPVKRNVYRQEQIEYEPVQEGPARMLKMMLNLCQSLACIRGRDQCTEKDLDVMRKISIDSIPSMRLRVLRSLMTNRERGFLKVKDFSEDCGYIAQASLNLRLEDLVSLGACIKKFERQIPVSFSHNSNDNIRSNAQPMFALNPKFLATIIAAGIESQLKEEKSLTIIEKSEVMYDVQL